MTQLLTASEVASQSVCHLTLSHLFFLAVLSLGFVSVSLSLSLALSLSLSLSLALCRATSAGSGGGQMKRMYSAVPGRVYVATRGHSASRDRELSLSKGDKVKGEIDSSFINLPDKI